MNPSQIAGRLLEFESLCRERGVPVTVQRCKVLEAVLERDDHPTADQIAEVVRERVPGISRTTVYRVLETLVAMDVIRRLHHPGAAARFDGKTSRHHHLICKQCHAVIDWDDAKLDRLPLPDVGREGFSIEGFSVQFTGLCRACRRKP